MNAQTCRKPFRGPRDWQLAGPNKSPPLKVVAAEDGCASNGQMRYPAGDMVKQKCENYTQRRVAFFSAIMTTKNAELGPRAKGKAPTFTPQATCYEKRPKRSITSFGITIV
jgi:hypothetical protein